MTNAKIITMYFGVIMYVEAKCITTKRWEGEIKVCCFKGLNCT